MKRASTWKVDRRPGITWALAFGVGLAFSFGTSLAWAAGDAHDSHGIPTKPLIYAAINFVLLILILSYFLRKPVKEFFATRAALIEKDIEDSQQLAREAKDKFEEYEQRLKNIVSETETLMESLKKDGELEKQRLIESAEQQAQSLKSTSESMMAQELKRAKEELKRESVELAAQMAEELLKKNINAGDQQRLVQDYLKKMEQV